MDENPRYRIKHEIGKGAFGVVYLAHDNRLERKVALKVLSFPDVLAESEREHLVERFYREARAAAGLSHPNIVIIHDVAKAGDRYFISMELLSGKTLGELLEKVEMPLETVFSICDQVLAALDYAHSNGIVHRDIKPDNIFILPGDSVKLVDFGLARVQATSTMTKAGAVLGSPGYIAPEVVQGDPADARADIFSFGVVLYEMLTGKRPFGPDDSSDSLVNVVYRIVFEDPPPPSTVNGRVPGWLDAVVMRCLAKSPGDRFESARVLREALSAGAAEAPAQERREAASASKTPDVQTPESPGAGATLTVDTAATVEPGDAASTPDARRPRRKTLIWVIAAFLVVLVTAGVIIAVFLLKDDSGEAATLLKKADRYMSSADRQTDVLSNGLVKLGDDIEKGRLAATEEYDRRQAELEKVMRAIIAEMNLAKLNYLRVESLKGVDEQKKYARLRVDSIEVAEDLASKLNTTLEYMGELYKAGLAKDASKVEAYMNALLDYYNEVSSLDARYGEIERQAEALKQEQGF